MYSELMVDSALVRPKVFRPPEAILAGKPSANPYFWLVAGAVGFFVISLLPFAFLPRHATDGAIATTANEQETLIVPDNKTILITDQTGTIVGQMAKIPAQNEKLAEIKTVSDVDKQGRRELLSIINKY